MEYDIEYFIDKFKQIPENYISLSSDINPTDAWEWCSIEEAEALYDMINPYGILLQANDGEGGWERYAATPKARILAFLDYVSYVRGVWTK